jgi:hypothetical protein
MPEFFQRLETYTGFQFDGTFINSSDFNQMVISPSDFVRTATLEVNFAKCSVTDFKFFNIPYVAPPPTDVTLLLPIKTDTFSSSEFSFSTNSKFIPATNQVGILRFSGLLQTFRGSQSSNEDAFIYVTTYIVNHTDSIILSYQQTSVFTTQMNIGAPPNFNVGFETDEMTFVAGKEYRVYSQLTLQKFNFQTDLLTTWGQTSKFEFQQTKSIIFGSEISFRDLFRMKAKDVFKDALNLRCLMLQTDNYSNITKLDYFNDIKDKTPIDWTSKLDVSAKNISFIFGKYARRNWLRFKNNTNVQDQIGDAYFDVSNDNLEADKDVVKLSHPATEQRSKFESVNIPKIKAIDSDLQWNKPDYRILNVALQPIEVDYTDGTTTTTVTECPVANFIGGDLILQNYYDSIQAILDKSKVVNLPFRLSAVDIENIDYLTPIYVECFGTFYLNKINAFKGDVTFCELVRL